MFGGCRSPDGRSARVWLRSLRLLPAGGIVEMAPSFPGWTTPEVYRASIYGDCQAAGHLHGDLTPDPWWSSGSWEFVAAIANGRTGPRRAAGSSSLGAAHGPAVAGGRAAPRRRLHPDVPGVGPDRQASTSPLFGRLCDWLGRPPSAAREPGGVGGAGSPSPRHQERDAGPAAGGEAPILDRIDTGTLVGLRGPGRSWA